MTEPIVTDYLLELSDALADVPRDTRVAIVAGVREELEGLEADEAAERIRSMGDPQFIAASAREDVAGPLEPAEPQWRAMVAAILVMLGGVVVPFVGWVAGIAVMWTSRAWSTRVKLLATFLPLLAGVQGVVVGSIMSILAAPPVADDDGFHAPSLDEFDSANPLLPNSYDIAWHSLIIAVPVAVIVGIWLVVIANKPQPGTRATAWGVIPVVIGTLVFAPAGWIVGLILLWTSHAPARTKAVMTTVGPVALILGVALVRIVTEDPTSLITAAIAAPFLASLVAAVLLLRTRTLKVNS